MREILFRGKRIYNQEWVFGNLITDEHGQISIIPFDRIEADGHHLRICGDEPVFTDAETIGQFTGLTDKNGVKIFEGDVTDLNEVVVFENGSFKTTYEDDSQGGNLLSEMRCKYIEVIGNIHDK